MRGLVQGRLRHRDPGAGHQHAGPLGRAREAHQVERRDARRRDAGGVHPADRPGRPPRHRRRGPRRRALAAGPGPAGGRRARLHPHLPAPLVLPAVVQHGGQPRRASSAATARARSSSRRSPSSRPTGPSSGWPGRCARNEEALDGYREAMTCHLGDFEEYAGLRRTLKDREAELARSGVGPAPRGRGPLARGAARRRRDPGAVRARNAGLAVVLDPGCSPGPATGPGRTCSRWSGRPRRLSLVDFPSPVEPLERLRVPKSFNPRDPQVAPRPRLDAARRRCPTTAGAGARASAVGRGRRREIAPSCGRPSGAHPCHGCADREDHARWAERYWRLRRETDQLRHRVENRTNTIARQFDRVCEVLESLGYLVGDTVTADGAQAGAALHRARPAWRPSACATGCGTTSRRPSWPRASRRWCTSPGSPTTRHRRGCPADGYAGGARRDGPRLGPARRARDATTTWTSCASPTPASPGRPTGGRRGARLETVLERGRPDGRRLRPLDQAAARPARPGGAGRRTAGCGPRPTRRPQAMRRGVVAYSSVG